MTVEAFRIENFMCFEDSGWVELRPITLFYGRNSAGKSALLRSLLLLRQSLVSQPDESALIFVLDDGARPSLDFGSYYDLVRDHDTGRLMSFWFKCNLVEGSDAAPDVAAILNGLGIEGTTLKVRLSYGLLPFSSQVALFAIALYDDASSLDEEEEDLIWQATAPTKPSYDQPWRFSFGYLEQPANIWGVTALAVEQGFFPRLRVLKENEEDESTGEAAMAEFRHIQQLLRYLERSICSFLKSLEYLGPLRAQPQRFYYVPKQGGGMGSSAQHIVRTLIKAEANENLGLDRINEWLASSALQVHLTLHPLDQNKTLYQLLLSDTPNGTKTSFQSNIREVGLAVSQILPVVAQTFLAPAHSTLLLEQPELHLHPGAQAELGDLFIEVAVRNNVCLLVETHSENLFLRMRRRIVESSIGMISPEDKAYLPHDALAVYFVHKEAEGSTVEVIEIGYKGELLRKPVAFKGFFSDDLREVALLTQAQLSFA